MSVIKSNKRKKMLKYFLLEEIDDEDMLEILSLRRLPKHQLICRLLRQKN